MAAYGPAARGWFNRFHERFNAAYIKVRTRYTACFIARPKRAFILPGTVMLTPFLPLKQLAPGNQIAVRGQVESMEEAFSRLTNYRSANRRSGYGSCKRRFVCRCGMR